jgi:hypothetical protein
MIVRQSRSFESGFTSITQQHDEMLLDFGILKLSSGERKTFASGRELEPDVKIWPERQQDHSMSHETGQAR